MTKTRKILLGLLLLGVTGTAIGAGTFASFSASTTNQTSTFATGTLVLTNSVEGGAGGVCSSADVDVDTNSNSNCDVVFTGLTNLKPGSPAATADLTIANGGTLTPSAFQYAMSSCVPDDAAGTLVHGSGDPCTAVEVYIQEYNSDFDTPTSSCVFPANGSAACNTSFSAASDALSNVPATPTTITGGLPTTRYFRIAVQLRDNGNQNPLQGRKADFGFTWNIVQ